MAAHSQLAPRNRVLGAPHVLAASARGAHRHTVPPLAASGSVFDARSRRVSRGVLTSSFGPVARPLTFRGSSMKRRVRITQTRAATEAMLIRVIDDSGTNGRIKEPGSTLTVALASKT